MPEESALESLVQQIDQLLDQMVEQQRLKAFRVAQRIQPGVSEDDLRDPHSFPRVNSRPEFAYEDGILAGLIAARIAIVRDAVAFIHAHQTDDDSKS